MLGSGLFLVSFINHDVYEIHLRSVQQWFVLFLYFSIQNTSLYCLFVCAHCLSPNIQLFLLGHYFPVVGKCPS